MSPDLPNPFDQSVSDPLPGVKEQLRQEYEELPEERIEAVARHALDELASARVKDFVPVLAWRRAREQLREAS